MKTLRTIILLTVIVSGVFVAVRYGGSPRQEMGGMDHNPEMTSVPSATLNIDMVDLAFAPDHMTITKGTTVRFVFHNRGKLPHEAVIGDAATQVAHDKEMAAMGSMHMHDAVSVTPGGVASIVYTFSRAGSVVVGCHQPGHYAAGMKATITVS